MSVEGERSDGSVNQGGKITSNLYVWMHIFVLLDVCFFFLKEEQFSKKIFDLYNQDNVKMAS